MTMNCPPMALSHHHHSPSSSSSSSSSQRRQEENRRSSSEFRSDLAVHVSNFNDGWTSDALVNILTQEMKQCGMLRHPGDPIVKCRIDNEIAYVEVRNEEEARSLVLLNGRKFDNQLHLRIEPWERYQRGTNHSYLDRITHQVYIMNQPRNMNCDTFLTFINKTLHDCGACKDTQASVLSCYPNKATWTLNASSEEVAEKLMYLNGMKVADVHLRLFRHCKYKGPPPKYTCFEHFQARDRITNPHSSSSQHARSVFLKKKPDTMSEAHLMHFLNNTMNLEGLTDEKTVLACHRMRYACRLEVATEELAEKLMYLNEIHVDNVELQLFRHADYDKYRKQPKYANWKEFKSEKAKCAEYATHPPSSTGVVEENRSSNKRTNKSLTNEPKKCETQKAEQSQTKVNSNKGQSTLSQKERDSKLLDATFQKQELVFLQEVATWKLENDRLKKEISKLARDHVALKQELGTATKKNDQVKDNQELLMKDQREELEESKKANAKLQYELLNVNGQLWTTKQQLEDVHQSWQEQQQEIMDQQTSIPKLTKQLEDAERRFRNVTESLAVQTTELANARKQKRELERTMLLQPQKKRRVESAVKVENYDV